MLVSTVTAMTSGGCPPFARGGFARGVARGLHHPRAARRVHVHHPHTERSGGSHGGRDGVRDVVELQVEENAAAIARERSDDVGAFGGEEAAADLEPADDVAKRMGQRQGLLAVLHVQRN